MKVREYVLWGLVILIILCLLGIMAGIIELPFPKSIEPIVPPITKETEVRLEFEKNNALESQDSPMHLDIELMDGGSKINFIFTSRTPSGTMKKEELLQQISGYLTFVAYELTENPNWVNCGGHVRFVCKDQGEIARVSLPVCEKFILDFKDWDKAWNYLSSEIQWTRKK